MHAEEHAEGLLGHKLALEKLGSKLRSRRLDLPGEEDLLGPGEQGDLTHLREVHANRIVGPILDLLRHDVVAGVAVAVAVGIALGVSRSFAVDQGDHLRLVGEQVGVGLFGIDDLAREFIDVLGTGNDVVLELIQQRIVQSSAPWRFRTMGPIQTSGSRRRAGSGPRIILRGADSVIQGAGKSSRPAVPGEWRGHSSSPGLGRGERTPHRRNQVNGAG